MAKGVRNMNQQQLDAIKQRAQAAHADNGSTNLDKVKAVALFRAHAVYDVLALVAEVERLRGFETKWTELLPKLETLRHYLFRVDRQLSGLDEAGMTERPELVIEYTCAFLSVMEFYLPSVEEKALEAQELTRLERLGQELNQTGAELKEEVKREYASLKAQVDTEIGRLEAENERLRAIERQVRHYLSSDGDTYQAYLKLCEVCGIPPEEPEEIDEYVSKLEAENRQLKADINRMVY
jgi:hypothetical protein